MPLEAVQFQLLAETWDVLTEPATCGMRLQAWDAKRREWGRHAYGPNRDSMLATQMSVRKYTSCTARDG
jgi:hypothetical protein